MKALNTLISAATTLAISFSCVGIAIGEETNNYNKSQSIIASRETTTCYYSGYELTSEEQRFADALTVELEKFDNITDIKNIKLTASELYPNDLVKQQEYIEFSSKPLTKKYETRALPAVVAAAVPIIAACVSRGLSGAALDQVVNALRGNKIGKADDLIWSFATGCVGWGPLKWAFNATKPVVSRALTWAVKQALKLAGKM